MEDRYLLGIDAGTSVIKSVLFDVNGAEVAVARRESRVSQPRPDWSEADMNEVWDLAQSTVREVAGEGRGRQVAAIGITGTCCGAWLIDEHGAPVRPAILWNDGRAVDILTEWQGNGLLSRIFALSGNAPFPGYTLPVLAWLRRYEPQTLEKARWLLFNKDWIRYRLTGELATEESDCSYMPFDIRERAYSQELFELAGVGEYGHLLPPMLNSAEIAGRITAEVAAATGLPEGTPVVTGLVDVVASTLGVGACRPGQACSIVGTSALNSLVSKEPLFEPVDVGVQATMPGGYWLRSLVNTAGTLNLDWMISVLGEAERFKAEKSGHSIFEIIEEMVQGVPIGSGGVMYHPYVNSAGVISPFVNPAARAQFFGVSLEHTRANLFRAVYEGVALSMLDAYEHLPERCDEILLSGGGAQSEMWSQMFADSTGRQIHVAGGVEFGARGAAMLAAVGVGIYADIEAASHMAPIVRTHRPDTGKTRRYRELYRLYKELYIRLGEVWWLRHTVMKSLELMESEQDVQDKARPIE